MARTELLIDFDGAPIQDALDEFTALMGKLGDRGAGISEAFIEHVKSSSQFFLIETEDGGDAIVMRAMPSAEFSAILSEARAGKLDASAVERIFQTQIRAAGVM